MDFKGGATFLGCDHLPHTSAVITNLEEESTLVERMYDAISGEMHRRQELFLALECLHDLRHAGEPLTTLMAIEQSQGLYAYKDVRASYARLGVAMPAAAPSPASLWDASPSPPPAPARESRRRPHRLRGPADRRGRSGRR